ncbi:MAG: tyrosine-type recombinase/integrase [Eubacteriales bacterium]
MTILNGRGERIRTSDHLNPILVVNRGVLPYFCACFYHNLYSFFKFWQQFGNNFYISCKTSYITSYYNIFVCLNNSTPEQLERVIECTEDVKDKVIISLFTDSGIRLNELLSVREFDIDWENQVLVIWGKDGKQRKAPFITRTVELLHEYVSVRELNKISKCNINSASVGNILGVEGYSYHVTQVTGRNRSSV